MGIAYKADMSATATCVENGKPHQNQFNQISYTVLQAIVISFGTFNQKAVKSGFN